MRMLPFLLAVSLAGAPAFADSRFAVVAVDRCEVDSLTSYVRSLREALGLRVGAELQSEEESLRALGGVARGSLADAERLLAGARVDVFQGAFDRAERGLQAALADLRALPPSDASWKDTREVLTLLAWVYVKEGKTLEAEQALKRILRIDPQYVPDPDLFPPSFREFAGKVRKSVEADATAKLVINTQPSRSPVFVEGRAFGDAPVVVQVPPGEYRVEARFGLGRGIARTVSADGTTMIALDEQFEGAVHAQRGPCISTAGTREARLSTLMRLSSLLGVTTVVALREDEPATGERYLVVSSIDATTGQEVREAKVKLTTAGGSPHGAMGMLAEFIITGEHAFPVEPTRGPALAAKEQDTSLPAPAEVPAPPVEVPVVKETPVPSMRRAAWIPAAAGSALLIGGGVLYGMAKGIEAQLIAGDAGLIDPEKRRNRIETGRAYQVSGFGLMGAGAVGLAISTGMYLWGDPGKSHITVVPTSRGAVAAIGGEF